MGLTLFEFSASKHQESPSTVSLTNEQKHKCGDYLNCDFSVIFNLIHANYISYNFSKVFWRSQWKKFTDTTLFIFQIKPPKGNITENKSER